MVFSPKKLLIGAATLLASLSGFAHADDCESGPWQDVSYTGGNGGGRFCATKYLSGIVITGVEVWGDGKGVRALQFYYSDGTQSDLIGKIDGDKHGRMDWDPSVAQISQIKTWGNGKGQNLGRVYIRTTAGNELDVGKDTSGQDTFDTKVASGIMLGAFGASGDRIDNLGFLFLKSKISKIDVGSIVFDETPEALNAQQEGLETVVLDYADHTNNLSSSNETFTFSKEISETNTKKYTQTAQHTFGWSNAIELSGEILDLGAKSTTTISYQYQNTHSEENSDEHKISLTYSTSTLLKPGQKVFCRATAMSGKYSGKYGGSVNIWLEDGTTYSFSERGTMDQVAWSKASSECQDDDFPPEAKAQGMVVKREPLKGIKFIA
ncbi:hypothetical protein BDV96DRAFT_179717 [Lophiotrema nucula]|uniref:Jacalin-type lectin domain-containing protein n=1 Tax=Lophiotrema nucula TaxID=690887 RepID=A0A6A5YXR2_9PLEO|nr:hypothetical protein BDV96DRAFT_179717 [Lophiotrema nucula]